LFLSSRNNKQWPQYEQLCAHSFRKDCIEGLDTIAQIEVYERRYMSPSHRRSPLQICIIKFTFSNKHEPRSIKLSDWKTRSKQETAVTLASC